MLENQLVPAVFRYHDLEINYSRQSVTIGENSVKLSTTEYRILALLSQQIGKIVSPTAILQEIWNEGDQRDSNTLQVNISRLRQKLKEYSGRFDYIETKHGRGYLMPSSDLPSSHVV